MVNPQNGGDFYGEKCKIILLSLLIISVTIFAVNFPTPTALKYINDYTKTISEDIVEKIYYIGKELEEKTTAELTVVIIDSLEGLSVEEYANQLFRRWGIGKKDKDNGVLFLVALKDRRMRIEVGYGLEGAIPDGKAGRIRDEYIIPYFKEGDYTKGVYNGYLALAKEIAKEYQVELNELADKEPVGQKRLALPESVQEVLAIIFVLTIFFFAFWAIIYIVATIIQNIRDLILYKIFHRAPRSCYRPIKGRKLKRQLGKMYIFAISAKELIDGSAFSVFDSGSSSDSDSSDSAFGGGDSGGGGASGSW